MDLSFLRTRHSKPAGGFALAPAAQPEASESKHMLQGAAAPIDLELIEQLTTQAKQEGRRLTVPEKYQILDLLEQRNRSLVPQGGYAYTDLLDLTARSAEERTAVAWYQQLLKELKTWAHYRKIAYQDSIEQQALLGLCIKKTNQANQLRFIQEKGLLFEWEQAPAPQGYGWYFNLRPFSFVDFAVNYQLRPELAEQGLWQWQGWQALGGSPAQELSESYEQPCVPLAPAQIAQQHQQLAAAMRKLAPAEPDKLEQKLNEICKDCTPGAPRAETVQFFIKAKINADSEPMEMDDELCAKIAQILTDEYSIEAAQR